MYDLPYFKERDPEKVKAFMREFPFVFISGTDSDGQPVATQVPVFFDERDGKLYLTGHIMRNSVHHNAFLHNPKALAVFTGPHTYVSATWYDHPNQASTWNYISVHAKGIMRFGDGEALVNILKRLTLHYENGNTASETIYDNLPDEYRQRLMKAIVAFEMEVTELENVFKLSQNHKKETYFNIIKKLEVQDSDGKYIAARMKENIDLLFGENGIGKK